MDKQTNQSQNQDSEIQKVSDKTIRNLKIHVDRDLCIGAASCIAVAPKAYILDSEAKAVILPTADEETNETLIDSARACPVAAIIVTDTKTGKQIFP